MKAGALRHLWQVGSALWEPITTATTKVSCLQVSCICSLMLAALETLRIQDVVLKRAKFPTSAASC
eukprot:2121994-Amphidinium_carterae.1